jgi:hypothetical protein
LAMSRRHVEDEPIKLAFEYSTIMNETVIAGLNLCRSGRSGN